MIRLYDVEVEKPKFKEIRGNPVWLRLKRRNEEAETVRREEKEERAKTKRNVSAGEFCPTKEKEETKKSEGRKEGEQLELYPKGGLMVIHSDKCSDKVPESNREKILVSQSEVFKDTLEEITPIPSNMEVEMLRQWKEENDRIDLKTEN